MSARESKLWNRTVDRSRSSTRPVDSRGRVRERGETCDSFITSRSNDDSGEQPTMTEEADPLGGIDILLHAWPWPSAEAFWSMLTGELSTRRKPSSCHQCSSLYVGDDSPRSCSYWPLLISQLRCGSSFGTVACIISCRILLTSTSPERPLMDAVRNSPPTPVTPHPSPPSGNRSESFQPPQDGLFGE